MGLVGGLTVVFLSSYKKLNSINGEDNAPTQGHSQM